MTSVQRVTIRFKSPSGSLGCQPSEAMHEALMLLSKADELKPLLCDAETTGKMVAIEVFQRRDGQPLLIHFTKDAA